MGKRGPKPKPTAMRLFEGDPGRLLPRREGEVEPESAASVPEPPEWLGDRGREEWARYAPQLHAIGLLTYLDTGVLSLYCEAWDEFERASKIIEEKGLIAVSIKGGEYQNPAVGIKNRAIVRIKQFGAMFGMGPSERVGMNVAPGAADDDLETFAETG